MQNQSIYSILKNVIYKYPPHIFYPARLLSTCLLHSLNSSMWAAIFPQKAATTVCLGFSLDPSSMYGSDLRPQIALTGLFCTASNISLSPWFQGDHACVANSRWGLTYCSVYISQVGPLFRGSGRPWWSCPGRSARFWPFWQTVRLASACLFWLPPRSLSFPIVSSCLPFMFPPTLPCYQVQVWPAALFSQPQMVPS